MTESGSNSSLRELIGLSYSPWTEKARWALDHHRLPYLYREHLFIFGVPCLRLKLRRFRGGITVPALIDRGKGETVRLMDSWDIALHADQIGKSKGLFAEKDLAQIQSFNQLSESILSAGRALLVSRMKKDKEAQREALPPFIPRPVRGKFLFLASLAMTYLNREFRMKDQGPEFYEETLHQGLKTLQTGLQRAAGDYLLGKFSYADIAMAVTLQFAEPVSEPYLKIGNATRRCWRSEKLRSEFPDLVQWRDRLYRRHRLRRP